MNRNMRSQNKSPGDRPRTGSADFNTFIEAAADDITERVKLERQLIESNRTFASLMDEADEAFILLDPDLRLVEMNKTALGLWNAKRESALGKHILELWPPDGDSRALTEFQETLRTGIPRIIEDVTDHLNIAGKPVSMRVFKVDGMLGVIIADISEQKRAAEALAESEKQHRALVEAAGKAGLGIEIVQNLDDREAAIVFVNDEYCRMLGYSREELIGKSEWELLAPDCVADVKDKYRRRQSGEDVTGFYETTLVKKDGSCVPIETSVSTMTYLGKIATVSYFRDIADRKRAEKALAESEEHYSALVRSLTDAVLRIRAGEIVWCNKRAEEIYGYSRSELIGVTTALFYPPNIDQAQFEAGIRNSFREQGAYQGTSTFARKDGTLIEIEYSLSRIAGKSPPEIMAVARDVTDRTNAEKALKESEEQFRAVVESSRDAIVIVQGRKVVFGNQALFEMLKATSHDQVIGHDYRDFILPDYTDLVESSAVIKKDERHIAPGCYEFKAVRCDRTVFEAEFSLGDIKYKGRPARQAVVRDISQRKRAEEALAQSEEWHRALVDTAAKAGLGISIVQDTEDREAAILFANDEYCKMSGYSGYELLAMSAWDLIAPDELESIQDRYRRRQKGENVSANYEETILRKNGSLLPTETSVSTFMYHGRTATVSYYVDISERKRVEKALADSEEWHRALVDTTGKAGLGITIEQNTSDHEAAIVFVNDEYCRMSGYSREELLKMSALDLVTPEELATLSDRYRRRQKGENITSHYESSILRKDGSALPAEISLSTMNYRDRVATVAYFLDISERKRVELELQKHRQHLEDLVEDRTRELKMANLELQQQIAHRQRVEEALAQSEEYFRSLVENALDAFGIIGANGTIQYESPSIERVFGYKAGELLGKNSLEMIHPEDVDRVKGIFARLLQEPGATEHLEIRARHKDGSWRVTEVIAGNMLADRVVGGIVANFRDVTERKHAEEKFQELYRQERSLRLQLESEMKRRVEFSRALAHELKTPLTSVLASSDLLVSEIADEPLRGLARNISRGASNLNSRIDELLDLAKGEVGTLSVKMEPVNPLQLLKETGQGMVPVAASQQQSMILDLPPRLGPVQGDASRLQQVVTNLLSNAIKFTPRGGKIILRAREKDGDLVVEVQDTGPGISPEDQKRLFEPYQRLDKEHLSGLGLGLALSKMLVELQKGKIWARSQPGKGSVFSFSLPLGISSGQSAHTDTANKLWRVLIIEDDQEIVDSVALAFQIRWPEARLISTRLGEEGIDLVETEDPDIIILDLGLPDLSGFEVLRQIRLFSAVPILILTVRSDETDLVKGLEWGADDYVVKPFKQAELLARLKVQLRKRSSTEDEEAPVVCGLIRFDPSTCQLTYGNKEISLTIIEGRIIQHLLKNAGHVATYERLAEAVWDEDYPGSLTSLRVYIRRLRNKLEPDPADPRLILTKAGVGYSLAKPA
ncbi:MAG: PAS domain S-box protein [Dehalococcoidia bacterium]|nr:PAS domain S-box protein [Dehalococcoidia bacterium]